MCSSPVQLLKLRARFLWRVSFKPLLGGRGLIRVECFVALACRTSKLTGAACWRPVERLVRADVHYRVYLYSASYFKNFTGSKTFNAFYETESNG